MADDEDRDDDYDHGDPIMSLAREEARRMGYNYVGTEHVLLALLRQQGGRATRRIGDENEKDSLCRAGQGREDARASSEVETPHGSKNRLNDAAARRYGV